MNRVCNRHGVPEYCPDGVCRWCEAPVMNVDRPTAPGRLPTWRLPTFLDYAKALGEVPIFSKRMKIDPPLVIKKVGLLPGDVNPLIEDLPYREGTKFVGMDVVVDPSLKGDELRVAGPMTATELRRREYDAFARQVGCRCAACELYRSTNHTEIKP